MTHEEIIAMAREEGLSFVPDTNSPLARIVRKAVAKEREACAQVCDAERQDFGGVAAGPMTRKRVKPRPSGRGRKARSPSGRLWAPPINQQP